MYRQYVEENRQKLATLNSMNEAFQLSQIHKTTREQSNLPRKLLLNYFINIGRQDGQVHKYKHRIAKFLKGVSIFPLLNRCLVGNC